MVDLNEPSHQTLHTQYLGKLITLMCSTPSSYADTYAWTSALTQALAELSKRIYPAETREAETIYKELLAVLFKSQGDQNEKV